MKRVKFLELNEALETVSEKGGVKFKYAIIKNLKLISSDVESLQKLIGKNNETLNDYNKARIEFIQQKLNGRKEIKETDTDYEDVKSFLEKLEKVDFKTDFEEYDKKSKELETFLNEEVDNELDFYKVNFEDLPEDISKKELKELMDFEIIKKEENDTNKTEENSK